MATTFIRRKDMAKTPQSPLQDWMFKRGMTQSWLSEATGLRQPLISKIATKKTKPDVFQARHILNALQKVSSDVTLEDLWPMNEEDTY